MDIPALRERRPDGYLAAAVEMMFSVHLGILAMVAGSLRSVAGCPLKLLVADASGISKVIQRYSTPSPHSLSGGGRRCARRS